MVTSSEVTPTPATKPPNRAGALLLFAMVLNSVVRNRAYQWDVVGRYPTPLQRPRGHLTALRHRPNAATAAGARPVIGGDR
ncbi:MULTISPECIES: hypothetical protein [unclassified Streptomyces]|uniref:hypothetical protein n=1 Tax=unclassified Streptomyces TaxID=2593676 RepID=UPI002E20DA46|nr:MULTISPECIES: hypothetical protein [unclassified Streptomyces]